MGNVDIDTPSTGLIHHAHHGPSSPTTRNLSESQVNSEFQVHEGLPSSLHLHPRSILPA